MNDNELVDAFHIPMADPFWDILGRPIYKLLVPDAQGFAVDLARAGLALHELPDALRYPDS